VFIRSKVKKGGALAYDTFWRSAAGGRPGKSINVELPEKVAEELSRRVDTGWFRDEGEAVRVALVKFLSHRAAVLPDRFQHDDIEWALRERQKAQRRSASGAIPAACCSAPPQSP
jgi:Arc/MetJ-type ribon-helix-helix transcriptional regulator